MSGYGNPAPPQPHEKRADLLGYVAGGLGVLMFAWGFLDWFTQGSQGVAGYSIAGAGASAVIGLSLVAGLLAVARAYEHRPASVEPVVVSVAALLVVFGILIGKSSIDGSGGVGAGVGLILALVTVIGQVGALTVAWLTATGRMPAPRPAAPRPAAPTPAQWQPGQYQPSAGPAYQPPQSYQPPAPQLGYQPPAPAHPGYQPPPGYPPPGNAGYQPPENSGYEPPRTNPGQ